MSFSTFATMMQKYFLFRFVLVLLASLFFTIVFENAHTREVSHYVKRTSPFFGLDTRIQTNFSPFATTTQKYFLLRFVLEFLASLFCTIMFEKAHTREIPHCMRCAHSSCNGGRYHTCASSSCDRPCRPYRENFLAQVEQTKESAP